MTHTHTHTQRHKHTYITLAKGALEADAFGEKGINVMSSPHSSPEGHGGVSCGNGLNFDPSLREEGAFSADGEVRPHHEYISTKDV